MKKINIILVLFFLAKNITAQNLNYKNFKWEEKPKRHVLDDSDKQDAEIILKKTIANEFAFEGGSLYSYYFIHIITRVNSDEAISTNNRVYIPTGSNVEILETKARVINSKGEIIELNQDDIKEAKDEEQKRSYNFFAFKGVDIGSEIEYYYLLKQSPNTNGAKIVCQNDIKTKNFKFQLIAPEHLFFKFKSYNNFPEVAKDTINTEKNIWFTHIEEITALKNEKMSSYDSELQSLIYKLDYNSFSKQSDFVNYSTVSKNYYANVIVESNKKTQKKIGLLLKESKAKEAQNQEEKIRLLEQYIKTNFSYQSFSNQEFGKLDFILENKLASRIGLMRLYGACLKAMEIPFHLVLTCDRFKNEFDIEFDSYSYFDEQIFYFPDIDKYLAPRMIFSRIGYLPPSFTNNYGLFIKPVRLGEFESAVGEVKFIEALSHQYNSDTMNIFIQFKDIKSPEISYTKSQMGVDVMSVQPLYDFVDGEDEDNLDQSIAKFINPDIEIEDVQIVNKGGIHFGTKPLKSKVKLADGSFVLEKAGNRYLFKIGELIGPQLELYQEKGEERQLDIQLIYNHSYYRTITFNIPEGYKIKNLEDLNFEVKLEYENELSSFFISNYSIDGNTVVLYNEEVYNSLYYPKEYFEKYQKVINAAADFNKVTLVLEKK